MGNEQKTKELLESIERSSRKQCMYAKLQFILSIIGAAACVVALVFVLTIAPQVQEMVTQTEIVLSNLESVTYELAKVDLIGMVENINSLVNNVDGLVDASETNIAQMMDNINQIDFTKLNDAIKDLSSVIEPIAKFFKTFKF